PGVELVLFAQRVVFGSDYEDGQRVHSSAPSSACARPDRPSGFSRPPVRVLRCPEHVPSPSRTLRKSAGKPNFSRSDAGLGPSERSLANRRRRPNLPDLARKILARGGGPRAQKTPASRARGWSPRAAPGLMLLGAQIRQIRPLPIQEQVDALNLTLRGHYAY